MTKKIKQAEGQGIIDEELNRLFHLSGSGKPQRKQDLWSGRER
jgi:hypothetical protein